MEVYAAQIDRMDQGIGRIIAALEKNGQLDNTLLIFLADNGACAEDIPEDVTVDELVHKLMIAKSHTRSGEPVHFGNDPSRMPGPENTYQSYGTAWANLSNTPFRLYKHWIHEGGISTPADRPLAGRHQRQGRRSATRRATCPTSWRPSSMSPARPIPTRGTASRSSRSKARRLAPVFAARPADRPPMFWEHEGNAAVRIGKWKLVSNYPAPWELYDMEADRTELNDLAARHPERVADMARQYEAWAERCGVIEREKIVDADGEPGRHARVLGKVGSAGEARAAAHPKAGRRVGAADRLPRMRRSGRPLAAPELIAIGALQLHRWATTPPRPCRGRRGAGAARRARRLSIAPATVTNREFGDFVRATRYLTDAERAGFSFVFFLQVPEAARSGATGCARPALVAAGADASLAAPRGAGLGRPRPARPSRRARLLERCPGLLRLGRAAPADRSRMGIRGARRARGQALPWGDDLAPTACRAATSGAARFRTRLPRAGRPGRSPRQRRGERLRPVQRRRQCLGMVCRLVRHRVSPQQRYRDPLRPSPRAADRCAVARSFATTPTATAIASPPAGSNTPDSSASNCGFRVVG